MEKSGGEGGGQLFEPPSTSPWAPSPKWFSQVGSVLRAAVSWERWPVVFHNLTLPGAVPWHLPQALPTSQYHQHLTCHSDLLLPCHSLTVCEARLLWQPLQQPRYFPNDSGWANTYKCFCINAPWGTSWLSLVNSKHSLFHPEGNGATSKCNLWQKANEWYLALSQIIRSWKGQWEFIKPPPFRARENDAQNLPTKRWSLIQFFGQSNPCLNPHLYLFYI